MRLSLAVAAHGPSLWEDFLLLCRIACLVVGRITRLSVRNRGEFDAEGERLSVAILKSS